MIFIEILRVKFPHSTTDRSTGQLIISILCTSLTSIFDSIPDTFEERAYTVHMVLYSVGTRALIGPQITVKGGNMVAQNE